jgi:hypothetical protein
VLSVLISILQEVSILLTVNNALLVNLACIEVKKPQELLVSRAISVLQDLLLTITKSALWDTNAQHNPLRLLLAPQENISLTLFSHLANPALKATIAIRLECSYLKSVLRVGTALLILKSTM